MTEDMKEVFRAARIPVPLLSPVHHQSLCDSVSDEGGQRVCDTYKEQVSAHRTAVVYYSLRYHLNIPSVGRSPAPPVTPTSCRRRSDRGVPLPKSDQLKDTKIKIIEKWRTPNKTGAGHKLILARPGERPS